MRPCVAWAVCSCFVTLSYATTPNPFFDGSEEALQQVLARAEAELKIFVYPIPPDIRRCNMYGDGPSSGGGFPKNPFGSRHREMFSMEQRLPAYLRTLATSNPDEADVFVIDHEWMCLRVGNEEHARKSHWADAARDRFSGDLIAKEHMLPVFKHVVERYPYFNRSGGRDHFLTMVYDNGPFCGGAHTQPGFPHVGPIVRWLENVRPHCLLWRCDARRDAR